MRLDASKTGVYDPANNAISNHVLNAGEKIMRTELKVCEDCVMDTSDSAITFDEHGHCDHYETFYNETLPNWPNSEGAEALLESMAKK